MTMEFARDRVDFSLSFQCNACLPLGLIGYLAKGKPTIRP